MKTRYPTFYVLAALLVTAVVLLLAPDPAAAAGMLILANAPAAIEMEVLQKALADHGIAWKTFMEKQTDTMDELKDRMVAAEQKLSKRGATDGGNADDVIGSANGERLLKEFEQRDAKWSERLYNGEIKSFGFALKRLVQSTKAAIVSTSDLVQPQRDGMIINPFEQRLTIRDLMPVIPTNSGSVEFTRELVFTNSAGVQYDASSPAPTSEGVIKNESGITFELASAPVKTIAHWIPASRQVLADRRELQNHIDMRLLYGLKLEEEDQLLNGTGSSGNIDGLVHQATAYSGGATNSGGVGATTQRLDTLRRAITQLQIANATPTGIVLHPTDWMEVELLKDSTGQYLTVVERQNGREVAWRVPVVVSNSMTVGQFLIGDFARGAAIRDREEARIEISREHSDFFVRNLVAILCEERLALTVFRPAAFVLGSF